MWNRKPMRNGQVAARSVRVARATPCADSAAAETQLFRKTFRCAPETRATTHATARAPPAGPQINLLIGT